MNRNTGLILLILLSLLVIKWWLSPPPPPPPPPTAKIDPTPAVLDFGEVFVGHTGTGTAVWNNTTLTPANMVSAGTSDPGFGFNAATFTAGNLAVGGNSGTLTFTFSPTEDKAYTGTGQLVVIGNKTSKLELKGAGVYKKARGTTSLSLPQPAGAAAGTPAPKFLDFGGVKVGKTATLSITIANSDPVNPVSLTALWNPGGQGFAAAAPAAPNMTYNIAKASSLSVNITFTPAAVQKYADSVIFSDGGANSCGVVVQGEGTE